MKTRNSVLCALGLAAAITLGGAAEASAQARSTTRIPVRKDQPAVAPHVDTVTVTHVDTVTLRGRTDTVMMTRFDTVMRMVSPPLQRLPSFYFGLGAGVAVPMNHFRDFIHDGPVVQGQLAFFPGMSPLGLRFDASYAWFAHRKTDCLNCPDTKAYQTSADLVLRIPLDRQSKLNPVIYLLGGGGLDKFSDFIPYRNTQGRIVTAGSDTYLNGPIRLTAGNGPAGAGTAGISGTKSLFFHYDVGGGLDVNAGPAHLYVEGKYLSINTIGGNTHYWPIVAGLKFY